MPGDRKHHTAEFNSCVDGVIAKGQEESSAYAICTTQFQKSGKAIFEAAEELRQLHLVGCASKAVVRTENGVEYIVVPVVALMEGVIHAVNAESPEFVPLSTLKEAAESWNGKPVTLGHPVKDGRQCSANDPELLASYGIGVIRNSRIQDTRLLQEAWVEKARIKQLHPEMHDRLLDAQHEEVSVGAFVVTNEKDGEHRGKKYKKTWFRTGGDHLAFLPGGRGACSLDMGCGAHRAASYFATAEGFVTLDEVRTVGEAFLALVGARHSADDVKMIQGIHDQTCKLGAKCDRSNYKMLEEPRIRHEGGKWILYSADGKWRLASHDTEADAIAQEQAIEAAKHRRHLELQETIKIGV